MKKIFGGILLTCFLTGCGMSHVVPNSEGKPVSIAESGYTSSGCIEALQEKAKELGVKIKNIRVDNSSWDTTATVLMWPLVKGATCSADIE